MNYLPCEKCDAEVVLRSGSGRQTEYAPRAFLPIPDDLELPTCVSCGHISSEALEVLATTLRPAFERYQSDRCQAALNEIRRVRPNLRLRDIEVACGVTETYLSHATSGRRAVSEMLVRLLEAFALHPEEVDRQCRGESFSQALASQALAGFGQAWESTWHGRSMPLLAQKAVPGLANWHHVAAAITAAQVDWRQRVELATPKTHEDVRALLLLQLPPANNAVYGPSGDFGAEERYVGTL